MVSSVSTIEIPDKLGVFTKEQVIRSIISWDAACRYCGACLGLSQCHEGTSGRSCPSIADKTWWSQGTYLLHWVCHRPRLSMSEPSEVRFQHLWVDGLYSLSEEWCNMLTCQVNVLVVVGMARDKQQIWLTYMLCSNYHLRSGVNRAYLVTYILFG